MLSPAQSVTTVTPWAGRNVVPRSHSKSKRKEMDISHARLLSVALVVRSNLRSTNNYVRLSSMWYAMRAREQAGIRIRRAVLIIQG